MKRLLFLLLALSLVAASAFANATITIVNLNAPGVGFNDPTPATPVGGNPGTTLGQQRLNAFQYAASLWGAALDSAVQIKIDAQFVPLTCTATSAVLGSAGAKQIASFTSGPPPIVPNTIYNVALVNKLVGSDISPSVSDINASFNVNLGNPGCLTGTGWYLGLDTNAPPNQLDLVTVLLHEFGHGLGFQTFVRNTGVEPFGIPDIFERHIFDDSANLFFDHMTAPQRAASILRDGKVVWIGPNVDAGEPSVLLPGLPSLVISSPASVAGTYKVGTAAFGPVLTGGGVSGSIVVATDASDAAGPSTTDGCSAISNAPSIAGNIALIDRGTCGFAVKVKNAQLAGATAVIIADNAAGSPPAGLGGADPTITIPSARITLDAGNAIKTALASGPVNGLLAANPAVIQGADAAGHVMLYSPNPFASGSSTSHFDVSAFRNLLMEPNINVDLTHNLVPPYDLTLAEMRDIGWYPDADLDMVSDEVDQCLGSDLRSSIIIAGCDTGVPNPLASNGCTPVDSINKAASSAKNHGDFISAVSALTNAWKSAGTITGAQKASIETCASHAALP